MGLVPAILRQRNYRLFFLATVTSAVGDAVGGIALAFAVLDLTGSAADLGLILGAEALALAIFVLVGGALADRIARRRLMVASDLVRAAAQLTIVALLVTGTATVVLLAILGFVYGTAQAFFLPASVGVVPLIVSPDDLQPANSLRSIAYSTSFVAGPVIGGALIVLASPAGAIALDAATFIVSAVALLALRPRKAARMEMANSITRDIALGWHEVRARSWVQSVLAAFTLYHVFAVAAIFVLGPLYAKESLDGASSWAIIQAGFGAGLFVGGVLGARFRPARPIVWVTALLIVAASQPAMMASGLGAYGVAALEVVAGICVVTVFATWETTLQRVIPEAALARVSSYDFLASTAAMPVGMALMGPLASAIGLRQAMFAVSAVSIASAAVVALLPANRSLVMPGAADSRPVP